VNTLRAFQGTDAAFDVTLRPESVDFTTAPALVAEVHRGDGREPVAAVTPTWANTSTDLVTVPLPGTTTAALTPGNYILSVRTVDDSAYLSYDALVLYPGTTGATPLRSLISPSDAFGVIPDFKDDLSQFDGLSWLLEAATVACEEYCEMALAITDVDKLIYRRRHDYGWLGLAGRPVYDFQARTNPDPATWSDIAQYTTALDDLVLDADRGEVRLWYRHGHGSFINDTYFIGHPHHQRVRLTYRAGYAIDPIDVDLGVAPVPRDLQTACLGVAISIREGTRTAGPTLQQGLSGSGRGSYYTKSGTETVIPSAIRPILDRYARAWGVA
jgi:hypothetical protein